MNIKKFLISLVVGSVLIGVGIAMTTIELTKWDSVDYPDYLVNEPVKQIEIIENIDVLGYEKIQVYVAGYSSNFQPYTDIEFMYNEDCADHFEVIIDYYGGEPHHYWHDNRYTENETNQTITQLYYVVSANRDFSFGDFIDVLKNMFETKTFYEFITNSAIEKVTIHTSNPELFSITY